MLKQLLPDPSPSVLRLLELGNPIIDAGVEFGKGFFLFQNGFVGEAGHSWRAEIGTDAIMEVASAGAQGAVGFAEVLAAFV